MATLYALGLLVWAFGLGLTAAGVVLVIRTLPPVQRAMMRLQKPWACDICMGFWVTAILVPLLVLWQLDEQLAVVAGPSYPWTLWVLRKLQEPMNPPKLPPLEGE